MTTVTDYEFQSDLLRGLAAKYKAEFQAQGEALGEARGEARGRAQAILTVLETREVAVPDETRDQVLACTDTARLDAWLHRAVTAATAEDVFQE